MKECVVCQKPNSSYTCPGCASRYCCAACCKSHKEVCKPVDKAVTKAAVDPVLSSAVNEDIHVLSETQKAKLLKSASLHNLLKNKRLRHQLRTVDTSDKRQKTLGDLRGSNEDVRTFVDELLKVVNQV